MLPTRKPQLPLPGLPCYVQRHPDVRGVHEPSSDTAGRGLSGVQSGRLAVGGPVARIASATVTRAAVAVAAHGLAGCAADTEAPPRETREITVYAGAQELGVDFDFCDAGDAPPEGAPCGIDGSISLRVVMCSASIACSPDFLHDPLTLERAPTLITAFSCGFSDGESPKDALLSFHPEVRCYTSGDPADRETWWPRGGVPVTFHDDEHLVFSQDLGGTGDVYTNSALLMRPMKAASADALGGYGFCELDAWGTVVFADKDDGDRRAQHVLRSPAVHWRMVTQWQGGAWNCHTDDPTLTSVERTVLTSATHDLPTQADRSRLPVSHGVVLLDEATLGPAEVPALTTPVAGAILRFADISDFPVEPQDLPEPMTARALWVELPMSTTPASVRVVGTCAELAGGAPDGEVEAIGVRLRDRDTGIDLGAIALLPDTGTARWDCERTLSGACVRYEQVEWQGIVPCLADAGAP